MSHENDRSHGTVRFDPETQTYHVTFDWNREEPISTAITHAIAEIEGEEPERIPSLSAVVNPDALDALFQPKLDGTPRSNGHISFEFASYHVTVYNDGEIEIAP